MPQPSESAAKRIDGVKPFIPEIWSASLTESLTRVSPLLATFPPPSPPTLWQRLRSRVWRMRTRVASWLVGFDVDAY